ncbi:unnamed protein product [Cochlearia groenlandica]
MGSERSPKEKEKEKEKKKKRSRARSDDSSSSEGEGKVKRRRGTEKDDERRRSRSSDNNKDKKSHKHHRSTTSSSNKSKDDDKQKKKRGQGEYKLKEGIPELSSEDYFSKNNEFATWLKEKKRTYFNDLTTESARELFARFVKAWNRGKLDSRYYEGISTAPRTAHNWKIKHR